MAESPNKYEKLREHKEEIDAYLERAIRASLANDLETFGRTLGDLIVFAFNLGVDYEQNKEPDQ